MRAYSICFAGVLVASIASGAEAIQLDSVAREVTYSGGLAQPGTVGDSQSSTATGPFDASFSDMVSAPGVAESGVDVSQSSYVSIEGESLVVDAAAAFGNYADNYASTVVGGAIADSIAWSDLDVVFTTTENMWLSVDVAVSSSLGVFYDGPGAGVVETSHIGSFLFCVVGGGCPGDLLVDDVTDNGMAVSNAIQDITLLPPGQYAIELLLVSQTISRDLGSAAGGASYSATIRVDPLPEPGLLAGLAAGVGLLAMIARSSQAAFVPAGRGLR